MRRFKVEIASARISLDYGEQDFAIVNDSGQEVARIYSGTGLTSQEAEMFAYSLASTMTAYVAAADERKGQ